MVFKCGCNGSLYGVRMSSDPWRTSSRPRTICRTTGQTEAWYSQVVYFSLLLLLEKKTSKEHRWVMCLTRIGKSFHFTFSHMNSYVIGQNIYVAFFTDILRFEVPWNQKKSGVKNYVCLPCSLLTVVCGAVFWSPNCWSDLIKIWCMDICWLWVLYFVR